MKTIEEMNQWSYKETYTFFYETHYTEVINNVDAIPEVKTYLLSVEPVQTIDLRDRPEFIESVLSGMDSNTLIFIDGPGCNGKTTLAQRIANRMDAEIVDIDLVAYEWFNQKLEAEKNPFEKSIMVEKMGSLVDEYLLNNLEEIIIQKSKMNKPVILVGMYLSLMFRTIIVKTLGRYFNNVTSLFCVAESFEVVKQLMNSRNEEFGQKTINSNTYNQLYEDYMLAKMFAEYENGLPLGTGMNASFIVDTKVSDFLK